MELQHKEGLVRTQTWHERERWDNFKGPWFMAQWGVGVGVIGLCGKVCLAKNAMVGVAVVECSWLKTQGWGWWW